MINKSNIGEVTIEEKGFKITIKQKEEPAQPIMTGSVMTAPMQSYAQGTYNMAPAVPAPVAEKPKAPEAVPTNTVTIKSPMIGTFYRSSAPGKPVFIEPGDEIQPGKVVCIIEAMKLFNEIESEVKGRIVKILVEDASPVEYDQPLFLVEPS